MDGFATHYQAWILRNEEKHMKHTRVAQLLARLSAWRHDGDWLRKQPWIAITRGVSIEIMQPIEVTIDPNFDDKPRGKQYAWWRTNSRCVNLCFKIQRILRRVFGEVHHG
jgi:hypothetical protein